jgi:orotidine-5'-phosphate decarboxylase
VNLTLGQLEVAHPSSPAITIHKSDYLLIIDGEAPFAAKLTAELAAVGLETIRASDAESAKQLLARSRTPVVLDLRYAALPITAALPIAEALTR